MNDLLNAKLVFSLLKTMPDYPDFVAEKNAILTGIYKVKDLNDLRYNLFTYVSKKHEFKHFDPWAVDYKYLLELIN